MVTPISASMPTPVPFAAVCSSSGAASAACVSSSTSCCSSSVFFGAGAKRFGLLRLSTPPPTTPPQGLRRNSNCSTTAGRCFVNSPSSSGAFWDGSSPGPSNIEKGKSMLWNLIRDIEPLDVSLIQKDVSSDTLDAMKRTISGMLGLLPSDQFHISIEAFWEPLSRLLVSSMMTGYTLQNAEYRLCLQRSLDMPEDSSSNEQNDDIPDARSESFDDKITNETKMLDKNQLNMTTNSILGEDVEIDIPEGLGTLSPEAKNYIRYLRSEMLQMKKELQESHLRNAALQMQNLAAEETNDLLDYLRSLEPEKVAELSEPTSSEVHEAVQQVIHGLLATLSPKMYVRAPPQTGNSSSISRIRDGDSDSAERIEKASLQFQPMVSVSRDYLARLLFWCMLLGHHIRGLEYRLELNRMFNVPDFYGRSRKKPCQSNDML